MKGEADADASDADLDYLDEYDPDRGIPFSTHLVAGSGAGLAEQAGQSRHRARLPGVHQGRDARCAGGGAPARIPRRMVRLRARPRGLHEVTQIRLLLFLDV